MKNKFGIAKTETVLSEEQTDDQLADDNSNQDISILEKSLNYEFKDKNWLIRALTHRSVPGAGHRDDYERLEFLGDAVIDLAVAHLLLIQHPEAREGELSKMRAALVNSSSLASVARKLNLSPFIKLSRGEAASGGAERDSILSDVMEAVVGAIYKESGFDICLACTKNFFGDLIQNVTPQDPKTELQEALHADGCDIPNYLLEMVEGPEHAPTFISVVEVGGKIFGRGSGSTKKASQQAAALEALKKIRPGDDIDRIFSTPNKVER